MPASIAPNATLTVALIGNPNTGKSTLFNALSGFRALTGNYPGVTVEKKLGKTKCGERPVDLIDLPGTYSLSPRTLDEMVAVDVLLGRQEGTAPPDVVVCIVDASNIERNLYLVSQVLDLGLPCVLVLNMADVAASRGVTIDDKALSRRLGLPVVRTEAHRKRGIDDLRQAILETAERGPIPRPRVFPEAFAAECEQLQSRLTELGERETPYYLLERLLLDVGGYLESHFLESAAAPLREHLAAARERLAAAGCRVPAVEARVRYQWARQVLDQIATRPATRPVTFSDKLDQVLTHRFSGLAIFAALMFVIFQAIYTLGDRLMGYFETGQNWIGEQAASLIPAGPLQSLVVDGVIAGVGSVLVFLPQIVILFFFIALLEDCGYMARAAFLMDKLMTKIGLSGKSFVPLMSSFACAIPGVMATRVIENRRDRMVTILIAPLMSCSARTPVYLLLIAAFVPATAWLGGWITLQGLALFGITFFGALVAVPVAWILKKTLFKGETPPFVMELPSYKWPSPRNVFHRVYESGKSFVTRAGTLIFATNVLIWAAGYFPGDHREVDALDAQIATLTEAPPANTSQTEDPTDPPKQESPDNSAAPNPEVEQLQARKNELLSQLQEQSFLGRMGKAIEPVVRPLGWDWRIGIGVLASFPAREVIVSTLGTIYSQGGEVESDDPGLQSALQSATWPDGRPVYNLPVAVSIMVFFALCAQCGSTLMVIRRETNSWWWPFFTFGYMTALAYVGALVTYQIGSQL